jgi:Flp pilus assembly protein TadD
LGLALFQQQKFDEALKVYIRAAQVTPEDPTPFEKIALSRNARATLKKPSRLLTRPVNSS